MDVATATLVDEGLGNSCYLVDLGDGSALVVDPTRDLRAVRAQAGKTGLRDPFRRRHPPARRLPLRRAPARRHDGAQVLASAAGDRAFAHTGLGDGDEVDLGGLRLRALTTPGHTDEHLSFLLLDDGVPAAGCSPADR